MSPQLILRCIRRPLHQKKPRNKIKKILVVIFLVSAIFFSTIFLFLKKTTPLDKIAADNQTFNWEGATSIYQFKIQSLKNEYFYLYDDKKVILIVK